MKSFWNVIEVVITQYYEYINAIELVTLKMVNFVLCEFHLNFLKKSF